MVGMYGVVVLSMALTPLLNELGRQAGDFIAEKFEADTVPIYSRAQDLKHLLDLKKSGATDAILENAETSLQLGSKLLKGFGVMSDDVDFLSQLVRNSMEIQAQDTVNKTDDQEYSIMEPVQVRVADMISSRSMGAAETEDNLSASGGHLSEGEALDVDDEGISYMEMVSENSSMIKGEGIEEGDALSCKPPNDRT